MHAYLILVRRELGSYFVAWTGYVVIAAVAFVIGLNFTVMIQGLNSEPISVSITELFFSQSVAFWLVLLMASPIITMRLFAHEKQSGTFETLMTAPVSDRQVVLAKFTGAVLFYGLMWLPLLGITLFLRHYVREATALDAGALVTSFAGILLVGMMYMAIGCLASALTRSQMIAAMVSFAIGFGFFLASYLVNSVPPQSGWLHVALSHINMLQHMEDFARGVLDSRAVAFYLSVTFAFLFLTLRVVESRRWK
jgi:ABC-2 type transport system permease protein